ncbi:MAG: hypothetical protein AAGD06_09415 [Acidobacteriota bacterium]
MDEVEAPTPHRQLEGPGEGEAADGVEDGTQAADDAVGPQPPKLHPQGLVGEDPEVDRSGPVHRQAADVLLHLQQLLPAAGVEVHPLDSEAVRRPQVLVVLPALDEVGVPAAHGEVEADEIDEAADGRIHRRPIAVEPPLGIEAQQLDPKGVEGDVAEEEIPTRIMPYTHRQRRSEVPAADRRRRVIRVQNLHRRLPDGGPCEVEEAGMDHQELFLGRGRFR